MPDVWANIRAADTATLEQLAQILERREQIPEWQTMRQAYLSEVGMPPNARVLEVGCGTGAVSRCVARWPGVGEVVGVDPSPFMVERARKLARDLPNLRFEEADGRALPYPGDSFDVLVFHTTLSHLPGPEQALAEAWRVLQPDGWLAVFDIDFAGVTLATGDHDPLQACLETAMRLFVNDRWLMRRMPALARAAGFSIMSFRSYASLHVDDPHYMLLNVERGADGLVAEGRIGSELAAALKTEARRRVEAGSFYGHVDNLSLIARKPA